MDVTVRQATQEDARAIYEIYAPNVTDTPITFDYEVPSVGFFAEKVELLNQSHVFLVAESENEIVGYAYAGKYREKAAYQYSAETTVYLRGDAKGRGLGARLYADLLSRLKELGFHMAIAAVTVPNDASIALHKKMGFKRTGTLREIGRKFDAWHDVELWQLKLSNTGD